MILTMTVQAGSLTQFTEEADFFRLLETGAAVNVYFYRQGAEIARSESVKEGYAERFGVPFDTLKIESAVTQSIQFVTRLGNVVNYDATPTGDVNILNVNGPFANSQKTVTNASGELLTDNVLRRYLLIQNNDTSGDVYIRLDGQPATVVTGVKISAGGSYEVAGFAPTGKITAIGSIPSNGNVVVVEG